MKTPAKKQSKNKLIGLLIIGAFALAALYIKTNPNFKSSDKQVNPALNERYTSDALKISFKYPKGWFINESGKRSLTIVNTKEAIEPNIKLVNNQIKVSMTKTPMLVSQTFTSYIKEIDAMEGTNFILLREDSMTTGRKQSLRRIIQPKVGTDSTKYVLIFVENNQIMYAISATPADSELIPVFNKIINSIEFK